MRMRKSLRERLLEALRRDNQLTEEQIEAVNEVWRNQGGQIEDILLEMNLVEEDVLLSYRAEQLNVTALNVNPAHISPEALELVPEDMARRYEVIPISCTDTVLTLAMENPRDIRTINELERRIGRAISPVLSSRRQILEAIERCYREDETMSEWLKELDDGATVELIKEKEEEEVALEQIAEGPVVKLVDAIIRGAIEQKASDIHIEPYEKDLRIRYRLDGVLQEVESPPRKWHAAMISRIKVMSDMDIAVRRRPQDGRLKIRMGGQDVDIRVSSLPTVYGEKIVMRVSNRDQASLSLDKLGMPDDILERYIHMTEQPYGMILVTGPTGSGKTSTLYATLNRINKPELNIITVEEPVEYVVHGLNQVPINSKAGLTFATSLRSILRQDPDVVMVGEMRDKETAQIGVEAALTGHLVFTTLHTNDAPSALTRLMDMGVESFLISASVSCIVAQRLVRVLCASCKSPYQAPPELLKELGLPTDKRFIFYKKGGCPFCRDTGYQGRTGIYEVLFMDDTLRGLVLESADARTLQRTAIEHGMKSLRDNAVERIIDGITDVEEAFRVVQDQP